MSSHTIANYLVELAADHRKINYCREILASNHIFNPASLFQKYALSHKSQITIKQFQQMLQDFSSNIGSEQNSLIFSHFQVESKQYLTYDQFYDGLVPQNDQSLRKLIKNREKDGYEPDYSVKYALNKLFIQIYESQLALEAKANFEIESDEAAKRKSFKAKLGLQQVQQFMNHHDKYPTKTMAQCIRSEINNNKGANSRNMLIRDYILRYLNKTQLCKGQLPKIVVCASKISAKLSERKSYSVMKEKEKSTERNITYSKAPSKNLLNSAQKTTSSILGSIYDVESNIKDILTSIRVQPSALQIRSHKQQSGIVVSLTHRNQLQSNKANKNETTSSVLDSITSKPIVNKQAKKETQIIRDRFNLHEESIQRINKSVNKQQDKQSNTRHSSSTKSKYKYNEDQLEHRYRRFNYLKQDKRGSSKRKQNSNNFHDPTIVTKFPF